MLTETGIRALISTLLDDPRFEPGLEILSDHTRLAEAITIEQLRLVIELFKSRPQQMRGVRMAVVTQRNASFGMMRMLSAYVESMPMAVGVFRDFPAAETWLQSGHRTADERSEKPLDGC